MHDSVEIPTYRVTSIIKQDGCTALMWASRRSSAVTVKPLLDRGALIEVIDKVCNSIYVSVYNMSIDLSSSCDKYVSSHQDGCTALMWAARHNSAANMMLLLNKGAMIDIADKVWNVIALTYNMFLTVDLMGRNHLNKC
jgi:ankyrin repeat protein